MTRARWRAIWWYVGPDHQRHEITVACRWNGAAVRRLIAKIRGVNLEPGEVHFVTNTRSTIT